MNRYSNPTPLHFLSSFGSLLLLSSAIAITSGKSAAHAELGGAVVIEGLHHLEHIFTALQAREQGRGSARITHIGDSHIIADFWTGEMRTRLQNRFGDGGRGFVLGGEMWRSYGQRHIWHYTEGEWTVTNLKRGRDTGVFGPGGAALICGKESCITGVGTREGHDASRFDTLDVFTLGSGLGGKYELKVDGRKVGRRSTFSPWLNVLRHRFLLTLSHHKVQITPVEQRGEIWLFGFSLKNSQGGLIYDSIGLNGSQAKHLLKNSNHALQTGLRQLDSQLLIFSFGINEIFDRRYNRDEYAMHLELLLQAIRSPSLPSPQSDCLLTGPFAAIRRGKAPPELDEVYEIQRRLSEKYGCAFWDTRSSMGGSLRPWQRVNFARKDGVHLSRKGYRRIARLFEESLSLSFAEWKRSLSSSDEDQTMKRNIDRPTHSSMKLTPQPSLSAQPARRKEAP